MKKVIIISVIVVILGVVFLALFNHKTTIKLNGKEEIEITVNSSYEELGASSKTGNKIFGYKDNKVIIEGNVDTSKIGEYYINYKINDKVLKRKVKVIDKLPPTITSEDEITISCPNAVLNDFKDYTVIDNYDEDVKTDININYEEKIITIKATDQSNNTSIKEIKINYLDKESPKISLKGNTYIMLKKGDKYTESGYSVTDNCDSNLKATISGSVDVNKDGEYKITYSAKDLSGNKAVATRTIIVYTSYDQKTIIPNGKTIYLTFDDGPSLYTNALLDTLKKYNVKATFFVTGQFPKYFNILKRISEEGHSIGIHTYTHKWSIYSSMDTYLNDYNLIKNVIIKYTGVEPKIFRFPGGSGNTVSRKYNRGIMTKLSAYFKSQGIKYFDWNISSGDTSTTNTNTIIRNVTKNLGNNKYYIVLQHDIKKASVNAVPKIIEYGLSKGYTFASLDETSPVIQAKINN